MPTLRETIIGYLRSLQERGIARLGIDEDCRPILREWMIAARSGKIAAPAAAVPAPQATSEAPQPAPAVPPAERGQDASELRRMLNTPLRDEPRAEGTMQDDIPFFRPGGNSAEECWQNMRRMLPNWPPLRELGTLRPTAVFGMGNPQADIMFVGDAPNYQDELSGQPFSGDAGGKLDGMLKAMGLSRKQVYITHLVKFRPAIPRQTINNRPPSEKEILFSTSILELEARLVQPKVIVALGVIAARGLLQQGDLPLAAYQQMKGQFCGVPVTVTHHPSYLLRTSDLAERRRLWEEMLHVMQIAGLPISDKQRGYFLPKGA
ncbi:MAG: uracil-DNA glycosylase [Akkermansia sp.]|nr:uracil-DNA glycosylase [Akkermansia sp.]